MSTPQKWLITRGADYIRPHIADLCLDNHKEVVIYDSLYQCLEFWIEYLRKKHDTDISLIVADVRDSTKIEEVIVIYKLYGVIHTAAHKADGESMEKPDKYFEANFGATSKVLESLTKYEIHNCTFSSTAAVYGSPDHSNPMKEDHPKNPISPYGASKLAAEDKEDEYLALLDNRGTSLRFFNVVGTAAPELMDNSVENLVPIAMNKVTPGEAPINYGTEYPTPDGTCIRGYVDVRDVADAHLSLADAGKELPVVMNVGTGEGASVREVIKLVCDAVRKLDVIAIEEERRAGDPALLCGDVSLIKNNLGFILRYLMSESSKTTLRVD